MEWNWEREAKENAAATGEMLILIAQRLDKIKTEYFTTKKLLEKQDNDMECVILLWKLSQLQDQINWLESVLYRKDDVNG